MNCLQFVYLTIAYNKKYKENFKIYFKARQKEKHSNKS